jgi:hypothetical protein
MEVSGQLHDLAALPPEKDPPVSLRCWVGPRTSWTTWRGEILPYRDSNSDPSAFQPVASRSTGSAISAILVPVSC